MNARLGACAQEFPKMIATIEKVNKLIDEKNISQAGELLDEIFKTHGTSLDYQFLKGKLSYFQDKFSEAKATLLPVTKQNPKHSAALFFLGMSFYKLNQLGPAISLMTKCSELNPDNNFFVEQLLKLYKLSLRAKNLKRVLPLPTPASADDSSNTLTCVILCGGEASRWNGYRGQRHKQLIEVNGEILLQRTLRQLRRYSIAKITVMVPKGDTNTFKRYCEAEVEIQEVGNVQGPETPAWKYLSSEHLWNTKGTTVSLLGDVWFSDLAINAIFEPSPRDWIAFGRSAPSQITGCSCAEIFAFRFSNHKKHHECLELLNDLYLNGACTEHAAGWALSALMSDDDPNLYTVGESFYEINDFTEDFDFPEDYDKWITNYRLAHSLSS